MPINRLLVDVAGSAAPIRVLPRTEWTEPRFLADRWELDERRIRAEVGFKPKRDPVGLRLARREAIATRWASVQTKGRDA